MSQLDQRLLRCRDIGGLTLADISLWLETPRETVKGWMLNGHYPTPALRFSVFQKLDDLEKAIAEAGGPLIPPRIRRQNRSTFLRDILDERKRKVSVADHP
jgi:hypothetical protein